MDKLKMLYGELQARGLKLTKQRSAIIKMLNKSRVPLTAEEIFLRIRETNDNTSLATVYRNLKTLVTAGLVVKTGLLEEKVQYRLASKPHSHDLICLGCHKVFELTQCPLEHLCEFIGQREGFTVTEHRIELYGYCQECGSQGKKKK
ncbi:MAG: Fur family transcriptional regulator [Bacillota bacterium]|nr:transcriptional repressor [Clostridia bacterium]